MQQIQFTGHNINITSTLREFTHNKFKRLERYADRITSVHVVFNVDKLRQIVEAKIHLPGTELFAISEADDMYKAIDGLVDKLVRQLSKYKGKSDNKHKGKCDSNKEHSE